MTITDADLAAIESKVSEALAACVAVRTRDAALLEEVERLRTRLEISPFGDDKIDELSAALDMVRHSRDVAQAEVDRLKGLLREARPYAAGHRPWSEHERAERDKMLVRIDAALGTTP